LDERAVLDSYHHQLIASLVSAVPTVARRKNSTDKHRMRSNPRPIHFLIEHIALILMPLSEGNKLGRTQSWPHWRGRTGLNPSNSTRGEKQTSCVSLPSQPIISMEARRAEGGLQNEHAASISGLFGDGYDSYGCHQLSSDL
jgi:hypothetical protein